MSLVDADALSSYMDECSKESRFRVYYGYAVSFINAAPTVNAVEVVRCKDCVNGTVFVNKQGAEYVDCVLDDYSVRKPTDYCSYGKRKEGADNEP